MPSTMPKKNWYKPMTLVTRLTVTASSSNDWKPSFSSIVATGSRPPYGVRFLPRKSYSVDALILLGSGITSRTPCLAGFRRVCCFLWFTIWVAPENRSAKLELRAPTVLTQDSQGLQMDALPATSFAPQFRRIIQVPGSCDQGTGRLGVPCPIILDVYLLMAGLIQVHSRLESGTLCPPAYSEWHRSR